MFRDGIECDKAQYITMESDNEQIHIEFHSNANSVFFHLLSNFELAVKGLNRQTEEFKFRQVKDAYTHSLKQQLENSATRLIQEHSQNKKAGELSQNLQHSIQQYLHLFVQKTRTIWSLGVK